MEQTQRLANKICELHPQSRIYVGKTMGAHFRSVWHWQWHWDTLWLQRFCTAMETGYSYLFL